MNEISSEDDSLFGEFAVAANYLAIRTFLLQLSFQSPLCQSFVRFQAVGLPIQIFSSHPEPEVTAILCWICFTPNTLLKMLAKFIVFKTKLPRNGFESMETAFVDQQLRGKDWLRCE
jgi:hypothetical protein